MMSGTATTPEQIDLTRLSRSERRRIGAKMGKKILGRNLGYDKRIHGSWANYYKLRDEEIKKDLESRGGTPNANSPVRS